MSHEVEEFLQLWEVHHSVTSAYCPHSNVQIETTLKSIKRIFTGNMTPDCSLNNDRFMAALLENRDVPDTFPLDRRLLKLDFRSNKNSDGKDPCYE